MSGWDPRAPRSPRDGGGSGRGPQPRGPRPRPTGDAARGGSPIRGGAAASTGGARRGRAGRRGAKRPAPPLSEAPTEQIPAVGRGGGAAPSARGRSGGGRANRTRGRRRNVRVLAVVGVMLLPFVIGIGWFAYQLRPGSDGPSVIVTIKEGMGTSDIAEVLARKGVIGSGLAFKLWSTMSGGGPYQPGCHTLHEGLGVRGAANRLGNQGGELIRGKCVLPTEQADLELFLRPGLTLNQIAAQIEEQLPGHTAAEFLTVANSGTIRSKYQPPEITSLEGLLFPDTYLIGPNWTDEQIVQRLLDRFDEIADRVNLANVQGITPYQAVVAASLIQTEAKVNDEAPLVSAVIRNRLAQGMQLQIDSTLCYAKGGCPPVPTDADKQIASPYNTYQISGLPPTPISSVTEVSLRAAVAPASVPYLFYVIADAEGRHVFATTLDEHNRNVAAAREKGLL